MAGDGNISYSLIWKLNIFTYLQLPCSGVGQATSCGIYLNTMWLLKSCSNLDRCYRKYWKENMNLTFFLYSLASPSLLIQFSSFLFLYIGSINHFANREGELKEIFYVTLLLSLGMTNCLPWAKNKMLILLRRVKTLLIFEGFNLVSLVMFTHDIECWVPGRSHRRWIMWARWSRNIMNMFNSVPASSRLKCCLKQR